MAKLPPAQQWAIQKMNEYEVAEEIEKFIDFVDKDGRSVALPMKFVKAWMKRDDGVLPILAAIATLPIVLADGHVLAMEEGDFDEERGIEFHIPKEVMALMPRREDCTPEAVADAMQYLTDEWLGDVSADYGNKCTATADPSGGDVVHRPGVEQRPLDQGQSQGTISDHKE